MLLFPDHFLIRLLILIDNLNGVVDEPLEDNDTALHLACLYGHLACVQVDFAACYFVVFVDFLIANVFVYSLVTC